MSDSLVDFGAAAVLTRLEPAEAVDTPGSPDPPCCERPAFPLVFPIILRVSAPKDSIPARPGRLPSVIVDPISMLGRHLESPNKNRADGLRLLLTRTGPDHRLIRSAIEQPLEKMVPILVNARTYQSSAFRKFEWLVSRPPSHYDESCRDFLSVGTTQTPGAEFLLKFPLDTF
jgi:hypothetical protein